MTAERPNRVHNVALAPSAPSLGTFAGDAATAAHLTSSSG
jgi:hypothetical protein